MPTRAPSSDGTRLFRSSVFLTPPAPLHSIRVRTQPPNHLMAPGTGTPDYAASSTRIHSPCRRGTSICACMPAALLLLVLAGCTAAPRAPDADADAPANVETANAASEPTALDPGPPSILDSARSGAVTPPASSARPLQPLDSTAVAMLDDEPERLPEGRSAPEAANDGNAWDRIRNGMDLRYPHKRQVRRSIDWYRRNQEYLHRVTQRARPYLAYIAREVEKRELPMEFALLPVVESAFRERAYSPAGAASGLWQFMPSTGRRYGLSQNWWYDGRRDVVESTRAALDYLTTLMRKFKNDPLLAVAAYNWGEGNVGRAMARNRSRGKPTDVWSLRLPRETRTHVYRFAAISIIVADPHRYGVVLDPISDDVYFRTVSLDGQVELAFAAKLAGVTVSELRRLNPGFKRSATAPGGPHRLQLPADAVNRYTANLARLPTGRHLRRTRHAVVRGDTLGAIAVRYGTSVKALKDTNGLASDRIFAGTHLMIPVALGLPEAALADSTVRGNRSVPETASFAAEGPATTVHRVRNGDSLWLIARRHRVAVEQLAAWNGLSVKSVLVPGQRLTVHRGRGETVPATLRTNPLKSSRAHAVHIVQRGDTLSEIAVRHGTTVLALTELNRIEEDAVLLPGQQLRLMPSYADPNRGPKRIRYRVKRGDSLWVISRQFGVSIASLRRWNRLSTNEMLMPGRVLLVHLSDAPTI